jgi:hypothetical protein
MESSYYMLYWNKKTIIVPEVTISCANFGFDAVSCFENGCHMYNGQCSRECPDEQGCVRLEDFDFNVENARIATCPMYQSC